MTNYVHKGDLPDGIVFNQSVAVDTETLGLNNLRDKLCVVQLSAGDGNAHLVQMDREGYQAPNLKKLFEDDSVTKIFHFARFDVAVIKHYLGVDTNNIYCTKIASKLCRTYTDSHGLKDLCQELLDKKISKQQQSSDWAAEELSKEQIQYAASDVLFLHDLMEKLDFMLKRDGRMELAQKCFDFIQTRAELDLVGWAEQDIFAHK
ncbi:MAG: ribonuclease H-like domain-containing protein [Rickettsiales bacterium]|nr:ribonuclease H-like domain-containing protein [Pseudomonadota bacterium]MDA0967298.1 ribonuclease H-like domain-containing protein [Pseudomonadota bacterium]MDG4544041.1 ribonuclease H-like domain-containing protein [Rickettsiales bacterium]MDG4546265.1 ribonuclease H-like domain-containing protein [Rickettsiales bacterium]MDG4548365.1 ribonuclease H-like domain-containing protein [Rickettsiales bacterium]